MNKPRKNKKLNKVKLTIVIFAVVVVIASAVFGRYVYNEIREAYFTSKAFYFTSDLLTLDNATYQYENWGGVDAYNINFDLYTLPNSSIYFLNIF